MRARLLGGTDHARALRELRHRRVNFTAEQVHPAGWHFDTHRHPVAYERPGPPEPGGAWELACELVRDYEFSAPELIRATYDRHVPLSGRNMLLEGRFFGLRFYMGVRVTHVVDEERDGIRVWGWGYETLKGHLEQGRMDYEVVKDLTSGLVEFVITGYSRRAPTLGPLVKLGWWLFGRRRQLRFYRECGRRLRTLVHAGLAGSPQPAPLLREGSVVLAPSGTRPARRDRVTFRRHHPGS
ncbi:uncharacterized protein (UPF0548 family) [Halopolyspora algeriensis]|uniref:Uncharacterized protein (UPF0548 family) n=1 Tax=Halopolyspora algeriensis TaxID=1500506 RepID=A0A368VHA3_9ACTN|nr:DUF1990 family protein [Halopolyspora algeriensis]RCW39575.1 uncharacterized protein (UPF0548 family) [Halopolyspora algeriensis]TQM56114.1 uncharacterized protein (UPF0548 family) [Halopolyspora algeriensis]